MRVLVSDNVDRGCIDILTRDRIDVDHIPGLSPGALNEIIHRYDALIVRGVTQVTADMIAAATNLKIIGRAGSSVENIDLVAATRRGVLVMNTPGGSTVSAAEHTVSMLLSLARNIPQACASLRQGRWDRKEFTGSEVHEKVLGLIGLGRTGRAVAARCQAFGMRVIGFDPVVGVDAAKRLGVELISLDELFRRSDFLSFHLPLTPETHHLLNDRTLAACKKGVRIINCARGGIIDEHALLRSLQSGHVGGAALDVFEQEPPDVSSLELLQHQRVIVTPHLAASTEEAKEKVALSIARQIADALHGRSYEGVVNSNAMHLMLRPEVRPFVELAEQLGSLAAQVTAGRLRRLTIAASGEEVAPSIELLKAGAVKGVLAATHPETVNLVNSLALARELGIVISEQRDQGVGSAPGTLIVRYESDIEAHEFGGVVYESEHPRLTMLDGFRIEVNPEGHLLVYYSRDTPGVLAHVASVLADHGVNIAGATLGRFGVGGKAICVMNLDSGLDEAALARMRAVEGIERLNYANVE
jgi:D-3-phosphoglycerate dehydrogenase / 2-oxoglutarate reductase